MRQVPLFSVILFDQISLSIIFPTLAFIFADHGFWYGVCMALMCLSSLMVAPLLSIYSDNFGRKLALLLASASAGIFALFAALSLVTGITLLLLIGSFLGGRCTTANPIAQAIIGNNVAKENKIAQMGYLQFFIAAGAFIGSLLGGHFAKFSLLSPCLIAMCFAVVSIAVILCCSGSLRNFNVQTHGNERKTLYFYYKNRTDMVKIIFPIILIQISWSFYYQFIPVVLKNTFNFNTEKVGLFVGMIALWLCIAATFGIKLLNTFLDRRQTIQYAASFILLGFLCIGLAIRFLSQIGLWLSGALVAMGDVLAYCALTSLLADKVSADNQGKAMGLCSMIVALVWTFTALLGGLLAAKNVNLPLFLAPVGVILFLIYSLYLDFLSSPRTRGSRLVAIHSKKPGFPRSRE